MYNTDFQRLKRVAEYKKIDTFAEFSRLIGCKNQQIFTDIKRGKHKISSSFAQKIHDIYPDISMAWLLTGEGAMLTSSIEQHNVNGDNIGQQNNGAPQADKQRDIIASQQRTIEKLTEQIGILINKLQ